MSIIRARRFACVLALLVAVSSDPPGSIGGRIALQVVPQDVSIDTRSCVVRRIDAEEQSRDWKFACGAWFQPPVGRYFFWAEQDGWVSAQTIIRYAGEPFTDSGLMLSKQMVPAGAVQLDRRVDVPRGSTFRLLSLELLGTNRPFDRRIAPARAHEVARMPAGDVIAGVFDEKGNAVTLSRPQRVQRGGVTTLRPERPGESRSAVVAVFERSAKPGDLPCEASLTIEPRRHRPDVNLQMHQRVVLAWYDLPATASPRLDVECPEAPRLTRQLQLASREIVTVRAAIRASGSSAR